MKITTKKGELKEFSTKEKSISIIANEDSHVKIISLNNENIKISARRNSQVDIYSIYNKKINVVKEGTCETNASINWIDAILDCKSISIKSNLTKPKARTQILGFYASNKTKNFNIYAEANHKSKSTESLIFHRGILDDDSFVSCKGRIFIGKNCSKCIAHQKSENILLNNNSECQATPILEVLNNDVSCSHGATISHLDEEKIFYALSRSIEESKAKQLITQGFLQIILDKFPEEAQKIIMEKKWK